MLSFSSDKAQILFRCLAKKSSQLLVGLELNYFILKADVSITKHTICCNRHFSVTEKSDVTV